MYCVGFFFVVCVPVSDIAWLQWRECTGEELFSSMQRLGANRHPRQEVKRANRRVHSDIKEFSQPSHPAISQTHSQIFPAARVRRTAAPNSTAPPLTEPSSAPKSHTFAAHKFPVRSHP